MKISLVIVCLLVAQTSAVSLFDAFQSVGNTFGKLLTDVVTDVRDTIDCTIYAVRQVLALGEDHALSPEIEDKCRNHAVNETDSPSVKESRNGTNPKPLSFKVIKTSLEYADGNEENTNNLSKVYTTAISNVNITSAEIIATKDVTNITSKLDEETHQLSEVNATLSHEVSYMSANLTKTINGASNYKRTLNDTKSDKSSNQNEITPIDDHGNKAHNDNNTVSVNSTETHELTEIKSLFNTQYETGENTETAYRVKKHINISSSENVQFSYQNKNTSISLRLKPVDVNTTAVSTTVDSENYRTPTSIKDNKLDFNVKILQHNSTPFTYSPKDNDNDDTHHKKYSSKIMEKYNEDNTKQTLKEFNNYATERIPDAPPTAISQNLRTPSDQRPAYNQFESALNSNPHDRLLNSNSRVTSDLVVHDIPFSDITDSWMNEIFGTANDELVAWYMFDMEAVQAARDVIEESSNSRFLINEIDKKKNSQSDTVNVFDNPQVLNLN